MTDAEILQMIATALDCPADSLTLDSGMDVHPDWSSLGQLCIMMALEKLCGIEITDETIRANQTVRGIVDTIRNAGTGAGTGGVGDIVTVGSLQPCRQPAG